MNMENSAENAIIPGAYGKRRWPANEVVALLLIVITTFAYRVYFIKTYDVMSADGTGYSTAGKAFFELWDLRVFGTIAPPLYSIFVGLFNLVLDDLEFSARLVSVVFSTLTMIPLYLMGREAFGRIAALTALLLYATLPFIHGMSGIDITEPTYTFFVVAGAYFVWRGFQMGKPLQYLVAGALLGVAYLARPEAFIVCFALTVFSVGRSIFCKDSTGRKKECLVLASFWCGFMILATPYIWYLHESTGKWQLSGKNGVNSEVIREYRGSISTADQKFRLDGQGKFTEGKGESLFKLMIDEPELFWGNVRNNLKELPPAFNGVFPPYFWPFILIGFIAYPWRGDSLNMRLILLSICSPLVIYVMFFVQQRGFYAYIPGLLVWTGAGFAWVNGRLDRVVKKGPSLLLTVLPLVFLCGYYVYIELPRPKPPYHYTQDEGRFDAKQVGLRLRSIIPENTPIMTRSGRIAFYAQKPMIIPPQASYAEIIAFARGNKAGYLIANDILLNMRPQLEFLYAPLLEPQKRFVPPPGLELLYMGQEPGGTPYLVYRIKDHY